MSAIEYGSYYWCVILNNSASQGPESIHLHADGIAVDLTGALTFMSNGRRPAGAEPSEASQGANGHAASVEKKDVTSPNAQQGGMIYFAFAPGTWKIAYAAKLQDGAPASVEHWNTSIGRPDALKNVGANDFVVPLAPK